MIKNFETPGYFGFLHQ